MECKKISLLSCNNIKTNSNIKFSKLSVNQYNYQTANTCNLNLSPASVYAKSSVNFNGISKKTLNQYIEILNNNSIEVEQDSDDGKLILSRYSQPKGKSFSQLGLDENVLFKYVKEIKGDAKFTGSELISLGSLKTIGGDADFRGVKMPADTIADIEEDHHSYVSDLLRKLLLDKPKIRYSPLRDLGKLSYIGGSAYFENSGIKSLKHLKEIGHSVDFQNSIVTDLGALKIIGCDADFRHSKLKSLKNLEIIKDDADFRHSQISSTGKLRFIGGRTYFGDSILSSTDDIKKMPKNLMKGDSHH